MKDRRTIHPTPNHNIELQSLKIIKKKKYKKNQHVTT